MPPDSQKADSTTSEDAQASEDGMPNLNDESQPPNTAITRFNQTFKPDPASNNLEVVLYDPLQLCPLCKTLPLQTLLESARCQSPGSSPVTHRIKLSKIDPTILKSEAKSCGIWRLVVHLYNSKAQRRGLIYRSCKPLRPIIDLLKSKSRLSLGMLYSCCGPEQYVMALEYDDPQVTREDNLIVHSDPTSNRAFGQVRSWIETCETSHKKCIDNGKAKPFPSRLLDLGDSRTSSVEIVLRKTEGQTGRYVALSHCWGSSQPFTTTRSTLESRQNGFSIHDTPATFRDAIRITRMLKIRYLWIDSLCIVQDNPNDWQRESAQMGDIYSNAYLTIAADKAAADTEGFLAPRVIPYVHLDIVLTSRQHVRIGLLADSDRSNLSQLPPDEEEPLRHRAWAMQERYLSPRILHFNSWVIKWCCRELTCGEGVSRDSHHPESKIDNIFPSTYSSRRSPLSNDTCDDMLSYLGWYRILEHYTSCLLTIESDRFPALSGIARAVCRSRGDQYHAGLWRRDMERGLLWRTKGTISRPQNWRAPSWSWASVNGTVSYEDIGAGYNASNLKDRSKISKTVVKSIATKPAGLDPFGEVKSSVLRMEGPLLRLELDVPAKKLVFQDLRLNPDPRNWSCDVEGEVMEGCVGLPLVSNGATDLFKILVQKQKKGYLRKGFFSFKGLSPKEYRRLSAVLESHPVEDIFII